MKTVATVLLACITLLAITNPTKSDYADWLRARAVSGGRPTFGQSLETLFAGPIVNLTTTRENYIIFSRFITEIDSEHTIQAVGVGSHFFALASSAGRQVDGEASSTKDTASSAVTRTVTRTSRVCGREDDRHILLSRNLLQLQDAGGSGRVNYNYVDVVVYAKLDYSTGLRQDIVDASEFVFYKSLSGCQPIYSYIIDGVDSGRVEAVVLGGKSMIHMIGVNFGGSGNNYKHVVLYPQQSNGEPVTSVSLDHSNMGGFFAGDLGGERGPGIAVWDAIWDSGTHYSPHRYKISVYRWTGSGFLPAETTETDRAFEPTPDDLPAKMNFPFRDQTRQNDFARVSP